MFAINIHRSIRNHWVDTGAIYDTLTMQWHLRWFTNPALQWRHNERRHGVSNHQPHDCLLNRLFRRRSKKTSKLRVTGLCAGIHRWLVNFPHKGPVTRKMFPIDDVIMHCDADAHRHGCLVCTVGQRRWRTAVSHLPTWQGLVWCIMFITYSHKCTHRLIWVGGTVCQKIAIYKTLILSHGHFVFSVGGGGLNAVRWRTRHVWVSEVEDCNFRCMPR